MRVSRQGLTRCPSCDAHVEASTLLAGQPCPLCGTGRRSSRSSALAAALGLGLGLAGCGGTKQADIPVKPAPEVHEIPMAPVYGGPPEPDDDPKPDEPIEDTDAKPKEPAKPKPAAPKPEPEVDLPPDVLQPSVYGGPPTDLRDDDVPERPVE